MLEQSLKDFEAKQVYLFKWELTLAFGIITLYY